MTQPRVQTSALSPGTRSGSGGRLSLGGFLGILLTVTSCAPGQEPRVLRLLDLASQPALCRYETLTADRKPPIAEGSELPWELLPSPARQADERAIALFHARARSEPAGELHLGAVPGAWAALIEIEATPELKLTAQADLEALLPGPGHRNARFLIVEFSERPKSLSLPDMQALELDRTWGATLQGDGVTRDASLLWRPRPETRALGLFFFLAMDDVFEPAAVTWKNIRLEVATPHDHLQAASDAPERARESGRATVAPFTIAGTRRPSLALQDGDRIEFDLELPDGASRLDAWVGIAPHALTPSGATASIEVSIVARSGERQPQGLAQLDVVNASDAPPRWQPLRAELPPELAGEAVTLTMRATTSTPGPVVVTLGSPRIVPHAPHRPGANVLLISLDTVRADRLGTYGGPRDTSPHIDALAAESVLFEHAWSSAPYTLPSHVSLLSGQLPGVHLVQRPGGRIDPERTALLAELLHRRGYSTGAFTGGGFVHPNFGFARGFESYGTIDPVVNLKSAQLQASVAVMPDVDMALVEDSGVQAVVSWLENHAEESFLLFFHTYIAHQFDPAPDVAAELGIEPFGLPDLETAKLLFSHGNPSKAQRDRLLELYDASLRQADHAVGRLIECLRSLDRLDDTIVILTSDHGKEIGEHGSINHGHSLHGELLRVPMILHAPGLTPARSSELVSIIDVLPTVLDLLNLPSPPGIALQGSSMLALPPDRPLFAEVENVVIGYAMREGDFKTIVMIEGDDPERVNAESSVHTFDLSTDPLESSPLQPDVQRRNQVLQFRRNLRTLSAGLGQSKNARPALDPQTRSQLEDLGYTIGAED